MKDFLIEYSKLRRYKIQIHYNKICAHLQLSSIVSLPLKNQILAWNVVQTIYCIVYY